MNLADQAFERLAREPAVWVTVDSTQGSVPRDAGTWMAVFGADIVGTIGGGRVEFDAIDEARERLSAAQREPLQRYALGPSLGQCCGGVMVLRFECVATADIPVLQERLVRARQPVALFGGGHVGQAVVAQLGRLPFALTWIDSRDEIFPEQLPANVVCEHSDPVHRAVHTLASGSHVLIMSFSHAEDLDVLAQCLLRQRERVDLGHFGLIGSKTKWATFQHRLRERGFNHDELATVNCPIGIHGIAGKEPEVIAVGIAAWLLQLRTVDGAAITTSAAAMFPTKA
ncbi:MAG: xanthine dehydrogenase accessory protein XdhC [Burkholderiaceae bacterium]